MVKFLKGFDMQNNLLDLYSDYLISQNQYATSTGLSAMLDGHISHDKITRFLNSNNFNSQDLWKYVKSKTYKYEEEKGGVLILDDMIEEKPYTDENEIVAWHFSHAKGRCVKGINILSCLVRYRDKALPIAYETIHKDLHFSDVKTRKTKRQASITKNEMFRNIVKQAVSNRVKFEYVLADNWFGAKGNMEFIHYDLKQKFIFGIKANRLAKIENKKGQYQKLNSLKLQDGETVQVFLKLTSFPVKLIKKIFKNEDGSTGTLFLVTNDLTIDADRIYEVYQKRWRIEEFHKSIKQNASLSKSPTKVIRSQKNHIFASIIAFCKLEFLKWKTNLNHFALKYKLIVSANLKAYQELQKIKHQNSYA
jgi:hypothetical protein